MKYNLIGSTMPALEVTFERAGEAMFTQSGGMIWQTEGINMSTNARGGLARSLGRMAWMTENIAMDSNMRGGLGKSIGRMFSGESLFMASYKAEAAGAMVAFASTVAGEIVPVDVGEWGGLIAQKGAFLCAEEGVELSVAFTKRISAGLFGGEGFILQDIHGKGMVFLEVDGDKVEKVLAPGESIKVDTGNVVAFEKTVTYEIETVKGLKNIFLGYNYCFWKLINFFRQDFLKNRYRYRCRDISHDYSQNSHLPQRQDEKFFGQSVRILSARLQSPIENDRRWHPGKTDSRGQFCSGA